MVSATKLESKIEELIEQGSRLSELNQQLADKNLELERALKILREENAILKQGRFGRSTERLSADQLNLFAASVSTSNEAAQPELNEIDVPAHKRRKKAKH